MANTKREKEDKGKLIEILAFAALVVVIVVVAIVMIVRSSAGLNDSYFVSDDTKMVMTVETGIDSSETKNSPVKVHTVYTYEEDTITGMTLYYEFESNDEAKAAYDLMIEEDADTYADAKVDGKYIVLPGEESDYADLTVEDVQQYIEFLETLYSDTTEEENDDTTEETTEDSSEEVTE